MLSGSEQNPDLTDKNLAGYCMSRIWQTPEPIKKFQRVRRRLRHQAANLPDLVAGMNRLAGNNLIKLEDIKRQLDARDREIDNPYSKDAQVMGIRNALAYIGDSLGPHGRAAQDPRPVRRPLVAVRLNILTRKTLGGLQTDLHGRVLNAAGQPIAGLYAAGEVAGFGGGGVHGYRVAGGHLPRRMPVQRPAGGPGGRGRNRLTGVAFAQVKVACRSRSTEVISRPSAGSEKHSLSLVRFPRRSIDVREHP